MIIHKRYIDGNKHRQRLPVISRSTQSDPVLDRDAVITELKSEVYEHLHTGTKCPVCNRHVKIYRRTINVIMAKALFELYTKAPDGSFMHLSKVFVDVTDPVRYRGDFAKLRYWGLVESSNANDGCWRITPLGIDFVLGKISIPENVQVFNGELIGQSNDKVNIGAIIEDYPDMLKYIYRKITTIRQF